MASSLHSKNAFAISANETEDDVFSSLGNLSPLGNGFPELALIPPPRIKATLRSQERSLPIIDNLPDPVPVFIAENSYLVRGNNTRYIRDKVSLENLASLYHLPQSQAAKALNMGTTTLQTRCKELGLKRWPYRKLRSIDAAIKNFREFQATPGHMSTKAIEKAIPFLEDWREIIHEVPDLPFGHVTHLLRNASYSNASRRRKRSRMLKSSTSKVEGQSALPCPDQE